MEKNLKNVTLRHLYICKPKPGVGAAQSRGTNLSTLLFSVVAYKYGYCKNTNQNAEPSDWRMRAQLLSRLKSMIGKLKVIFYMSQQ